MSNKQQASKNMDLTAKLADYIAEHPEISRQVFVSGASIVPFSLNDKDLNKANEKLVKDLLEEGKKVIKIKETKNRKEPWEFVSTSL